MGAKSNDVADAEPNTISRLLQFERCTKIVRFVIETGGAVSFKETGRYKGGGVLPSRSLAGLWLSLDL